uniref:Uncharacterized protein n=1 Tax=Anguilla anguilla TaxID=7936 RepID=A0A0E9S4H2_ANGAN
MVPNINTIICNTRIMQMLVMFET